MDALDSAYIRNSSFSWALWKVLDHVSSSYFADSGIAASHSAGSADAAQDAAVAALAGADRAALAQACLQLKDLDSPLVLALAEVFSRRADAEALALCAQQQVQRLSREEGLVLLAVLAYAAQV